MSAGRTVTSYERTSFIVNGNIVNGNIVKWVTKHVIHSFWELYKMTDVIHSHDGGVGGGKGGMIIGDAMS